MDMEISLANLNDRRDRPNRTYKRIRQGEPNYRLLLLSLGLLDTSLLIATVTMAIMCSQVGEKVPNSATSQLLKELESLQSRHLDVTKVAEQAKQSIARAIKNHANFMQQIKQQQTNNDLYWKEIEALKCEKSILQSNISALEGSCGKCLDKWMYFNSSCYFFSYIDDRQLKKSWQRSRADCISRAADLVVIDSEEELIFVSNIIQTMGSGWKEDERAFWVGLTDVDRNGTWHWVNNATEVNRILRESRFQYENCALTYDYYSGRRYRYGTASCNIGLYWICEMQSR